MVTKKRFRTTRGGPAGQLRVLFAYVSIPGSQTRFVTGLVPGSVASVLRRLRFVTVRVAASLAGNATRNASADMKLTK